MIALVLSLLKNPKVIAGLIILFSVIGLIWYVQSLREDNKNLTEAMLIVNSKYNQMYANMQVERGFYNNSLTVIEDFTKKNEELNKTNNSLKRNLRDAIKDSKDECLNRPIDDSVRVLLEQSRTRSSIQTDNTTKATP